MVVHINIPNNDNSVSNDNKVHLLPCRIKSDGDANVSKYFEPNIEVDGKVLSTSLRGYPLIGKEVSVPDGYRGYILYEANEKISEESSRSIYVSGVFQKFRYWNYDKVPTDDDRVIMAMNWAKLAKAVS